jgi:hypothetical protein
MNQNLDCGNENSDDSYEDSYFDDALIEIANEIELINAIKTAEPQKSDPQIVLKVEMELKKTKSSSTNIFQILKTLQEIKIQSGHEHTDTPSTPSTIERKYVSHRRGFNLKYHPMTITETVITHDEISKYQNLTIEDLFEDPDPEEKPSVVVSIKKKLPVTNPIIHDDENLHHSQSEKIISDKMTLKTVDIPHTITKNLSQQLKDKENELFRNLMKMQRR